MSSLTVKKFVLVLKESGANIDIKMPDRCEMYPGFVPCEGPEGEPAIAIFALVDTQSTKEIPHRFRAYQEGATLTERYSHFASVHTTKGDWIVLGPIPIR